MTIQRGGMGLGGKVQDRGDISTLMADLCYCMAETNTTL